MCNFQEGLHAMNFALGILPRNKENFSKQPQPLVVNLKHQIYIQFHLKKSNPFIGGPSKNDVNKVSLIGDFQDPTLTPDYALQGHRPDRMMPGRYRLM